MSNDLDMDTVNEELDHLHALIQSHATTILSSSLSHPTLPSQDSLAKSSASLLTRLPLTGYGLDFTINHLLESVAPALNGSSLSSNYYGFVTGGATPAARLADNLVTLYDQNAAVHLPNESIATVVEDRALIMLLELLHFDPEIWRGRTFTTGATASNVLGLACGREMILQLRLAKTGTHGDGAVGELGILESCRRAGVDHIQVLTTIPHSSVRKAASIVGLGRASVVDVGVEGAPLAFDFAKLASLMSHPRCASIVVVSCGEVNTGGFATHSMDEVLKLRNLCDEYGAWLHVDGGMLIDSFTNSESNITDNFAQAFGIFARALTGPEFGRVARCAQYLESADSITGDAHKMLNVPYDCGFFFCAYPNIAQEVFHNPNAAYLNNGADASDHIPSPLNIGIENSRRFRGLPVYATLMAYGQAGYVDMLERQVRFTRAVVSFLDAHESFDILPEELQGSPELMEQMFIIVLFRAKDAYLNSQLVSRINATSKIYVSGTVWNGLPAARFAVSNWQVDHKRDLALVEAMIDGVLKTWRTDQRIVSPRKEVIREPPRDASEMWPEGSRFALKEAREEISTEENQSVHREMKEKK
ncbi:hypothetical protein MMC13_002743 [Lambiella insularis]|nr:hypothetical protein [Lambiella insularis]